MLVDEVIIQTRRFKSINSTFPNSQIQLEVLFSSYLLRSIFLSDEDFQTEKK